MGDLGGQVREVHIRVSDLHVQFVVIQRGDVRRRLRDRLGGDDLELPLDGGNHHLTHEDAVLHELHRAETRKTQEDLATYVVLEREAPSVLRKRLLVLTEQRNEDVHNRFHFACAPVGKPVEHHPPHRGRDGLVLEERKPVRIQHAHDEVHHKAGNRQRNTLADVKDADLLVWHHEGVGIERPAGTGVIHLPEDPRRDKPPEQALEHIVVPAEQLADHRFGVLFRIRVLRHPELAREHLRQIGIDHLQSVTLVLREVRRVLGLKRSTLESRATTVRAYGAEAEGEAPREILSLLAGDANTPETRLIQMLPSIALREDIVVLEEPHQLAGRRILTVRRTCSGADHTDDLVGVCVAIAAVACDERRFHRLELRRRIGCGAVASGGTWRNGVLPGAGLASGSGGGGTEGGTLRSTGGHDERTWAVDVHHEMVHRVQKTRICNISQFFQKSQ